MAPLRNPPTLLTIPTETLETILLHLCQNDLCQCVLVSQGWNRIFTPYLWRTLAINSRRHADRFRKNEAQQALQRNASLVRELHIVHKSQCYQFLPKLATPKSEIDVGEHEAYKIGPLSNLHTLELCYIEHPKGALDGSISALVRQNPFLRCLKISVEMDSSILARLVTEYIPNLEDLDIDIPWHGDVRELLEGLPESIRFLRMESVRHYRPSPHSSNALNINDTNQMQKKARLHRALETLDICGTPEYPDISDIFHEKPEDVLVGFLESCSPRLKEIRGVIYSLSFRNAAISKALSNTGFAWTDLHRTSIPHYENDSNVARIIASRAWTVIDLYTHFLRPMAVNALMEHCENLTVLDIMERGNGEMTGVHLRTILSKAKNLKRLQAHFIQTISATDILMSEWATTTLEHIDFKIEVPRVFGRSISDVALKNSLNIQRQLLRRLGQQMHLKKLIIGGGSGRRLSDYQHNSVEFTLKTGLDELKDLKELEVLDIHHMNHHAGVPELEWMVENWPRIHTVDGMRYRLHRPRKDVKIWLVNHQPSWWR